MHNESQIKEGYLNKEIGRIGLKVILENLDKAYTDEAKALEKVKALKSKHIVCASL